MRIPCNVPGNYAQRTTETTNKTEGVLTLHANEDQLNGKVTTIAAPNVATIQKNANSVMVGYIILYMIQSVIISVFIIRKRSGLIR